MTNTLHKIENIKIDKNLLIFTYKPYDCQVEFLINMTFSKNNNGFVFSFFDSKKRLQFDLDISKETKCEILNSISHLKMLYVVGLYKGNPYAGDEVVTHTNYYIAYIEGEEFKVTHLQYDTENKDKNLDVLKKTDKSYKIYTSTTSWDDAFRQAIEATKIELKDPDLEPLRNPLPLKFL